jgi:2-keto-3-deoxygluconate permease
MILGYIIAKTGPVFGLSAVAVTAAMTNANGVLGLALIDKYGDPNDVAALALRLIGTGPLLTLVVLGVAGQVQDLARSILITVLPLVLGMIIGSLDDKASDLFGSAVSGIVPISMFAIGSRINLYTALEAGLPGLVLGAFSLTVSFLVCVWADRRTGGNGIAGATLASTAGNAVLTPAAVAAVVPAFSGVALTNATSQVAAAAILTSLATPLVVGVVNRWNSREGQGQAEAASTR